MITIKLCGGLGNQMFQYAAATALAKHHNTGVALDVSEFSYYHLRRFALDAYKLEGTNILPVKRTSKIVRFFEKIKPRKDLYVEPYFQYNPHFLSLSDPTILSGYFQSEKYFKDIADTIYQQFTLKKPCVNQDINQATISVSVHVRRGDYVNNAKTLATHGSLTLDYYKRAIDFMRQKYGPTVKFFMFSDDTDYTETAYADIDNKQIISGNAAHEDMHLMASCDHHIIANSSFSWWGAWLNKSNDKTVIAPKQWFAPKVLKKKPTYDLIPQNWLQM
ncbi:MAG: alpha-1,2-fucosyltransferase [Bacteroidota bacterium]